MARGYELQDIPWKNMISWKMIQFTVVDNTYRMTDQHQ